MIKANFTSPFINILFIIIASITQNCSKDDVKPDETEEIITGAEPELINTISIDFWQTGALDPTEINFSDTNGDKVFESDLPLLNIYRSSTGSINLWSIGSIDGDAYVNASIKEKADDHIVCFEMTNNIMTVAYTDEDSKGLPLGIQTEWTASATPNVTGQIKITLRHQPGIKNGECPGDGELIDFQITQSVKTF
jgi:hypothetical protein